MKNLNHNVRSLIKIVTVALICGVISFPPTIMNKVVSVISGRPTSKGIPIGMDFAAAKMEDITRIAPQLMEAYQIDKNER
jgi:hypothetical protein